MNHINKLLMLLLLISPITGCSYVSDYVEGQITNRASFSITAEYRTGPNRVVLTWDETDFSEDFAGIEIYRSSYVNDEYAPYGIIHSSTTYISTFTDSAPLSGTSFYRVGFIHWDDPLEDRTPENGYTGDLTTDYNAKTSISKTSGYAKVYIP